MASALQRFVVGSALGISVVLIVTLSLEMHAARVAYADLARRAQEPHAGIFVPTFTAQTLAGKRITVGRSSAGGRQLIVVFTGICPFCRASVPTWRWLAVEAMKGAQSRHVEVVGISWDSMDDTRRFLAEQHITFPVVRFPERKLGVLFRSRNVPVTMVLDSAGRVLYGHVGALTEALARDSVLAALFSDPPPSPPQGPTVVPTRGDSLIPGTGR